MKSVTYMVTAVVLLTACKKDNPSTPASPPSQANEVNLTTLANGQQSTYLGYETVCNHAADSFNYRQDTLILSVLDDESGQFYFQEDLTPYSTSRVNGTFMKPITYRVIRTENYLLIPDRNESLLFYFYGNDTIQLQPAARVPLHQQDCILAHDSDNPFIGNDIGFFDSFDVGPITMQQKTAVSCVPAMMQLEAYLIYDENRLYMSHTIQNTGWGLPSRNTINGWVAQK